MLDWLAEWSRARGIRARGSQLARLRPAHFQLIVALLRGLTDPVTGLSMGQTAENLAWRFNITRLAMDSFALRSHQRLALAFEQERLDEIEPLYDNMGRLYARDEGLRSDTNPEKLAELPAVFDRPVGQVTAGNSAQVTDGAALLLLASERAIERYDLPVLGRILDVQWAALDPARMGLGPVHAMARLLIRRGIDCETIDYWEINEAFAAQVLACLSAWQDPDYLREQLGIVKSFAPIPEERLNRDGGAISIGHPVGASGARLVLHLLKTLRQNRAQLGMASLCIGGGQGGAMLLEATS
jgi:acetyl-CoA C-acetyltransferase